MNLFLFFCLVSVLATSYDDEKIELEPADDPFPCLSRGSLEEVMPEEDEDEEADDPESRIFGGSNAIEGQLPYQAGLLSNIGDGFVWCGGAILSTEWILTTAQCIAGAKSIKVHLGSINKNAPRLITYSLETHVHPDYKTDGEDIALVRIKEIEFDAYIHSAALPGNVSVEANTKVTACGFGNINDQGVGTLTLKYVTMPVAEKSECVKVYGKYADRLSVFCTTTSGFGSPCVGDLGGPLVLEETYTLVGLLSFGHQAGCTLGYPVGFTSVSHYLDWIEHTSGVTPKS